jgi:hypothetical protein
MPTRPNRCQPTVCRTALVEALGLEMAGAVLAETGIADLPERLPSGPRDIAALTAELAPFVRLYRTVWQHAGQEAALTVTRRAIIESGRTSHGEASDTQPAAPAPGEPLNLTSPPPPAFQADPQALADGFAIAMQFFSCDGELLAYTPELVHFQVTSCNWCGAMRDEGAPELIPFFCETDERFMDGHPTHHLIRPSAIGLGHACCDFRFVPRE